MLRAFKTRALDRDKHNGRFKWEHVESCYSSNENISPLPYCLQQPNLAGWSLTISGFHGWNYVTIWSRDLARSHDKLLKHIFLITKFGRMMNYLEGLLPIKLLNPSVTFMNNFGNHYISPTAIPMATKLGRVVSYYEGLLPIKSHNPLITKSCKIKWQTKTITSSMPQCLWPPNLARWWLSLKVFYA